MSTAPHKLRVVILAFALTSLLGCVGPDSARSVNQQAADYQDAATNMMNDASLAKNANLSLSTEVEELIVYGAPFQVVQRAALPAVFYADADFMRFEAQPLDAVVELINREYSSYGISVGFTSDALAYLNGGATDGSGTAEPVISSDDSTGGLGAASAGSSLNGASGLAGLANIKMSLVLRRTNLKAMLDNIATRTGLWWRFSEGRTEFYRLETKSYLIDQMAEQQKITSKINTASSGASGEGSASASTSASHAFELSQDNGDPLKQLTEMLQSLISSEGKLSVSPAMSMVTITDTPEVLKTAERVIKAANDLAGQQIRLEIEIYEMIANNEHNYGINWDAVYEKSDVKISFDSGVQTGDWGKMEVGIVDGPWNGSKAIIDALQTQASLTLKKRSMFTTAHNGVVPIQFVKETAYVASRSSTLTDGGSQGSIEAATTVNGVVMFATPRVNSDGSVGVRIVSDLSALDQLTTFGEENSMVQLPERTVSSVISTRRVRSGQPILMTGFEQEVTTGQNQSVFGAVTWVMGGSDKGKKSKSTLLIMLTPYIEDYRG